MTTAQQFRYDPAEESSPEHTALLKKLKIKRIIRQRAYARIVAINDRRSARLSDRATESREY